MPVRCDFYSHEEWKPFRSDPEVSPFAEKDQLVYHTTWTAGLFREQAFIIRIMCQDLHPELVSAWRQIIAAGMPPAAMEALQDLSAEDYDKAAGEIKAALNSRNRIDEIVLARRLGAIFKDHYQRAEDLARLKQ